MKRVTSPQWLLILGVVFLFCVTAIAQESESTNNLSYPARFYGTSLQSGTIGSHTLGGVFPTSMSYGCLVPETVGTTTYPNTSCYDSTAGTYMNYEQCYAKCLALVNPTGDPGYVPPATLVEPIYWQKQTVNKWQAGYEVSETPLGVEFVDWGDNLESKSWPVQVIRVETNTFSSVLDPNAWHRVDMWHVFGQGTTELWGAHASKSAPSQPYFYLDVDTQAPNWGYGVNVTSSARLNLAKLGGAATCPTTYAPSPYAGLTTFVPASGDVAAHWQGAAFTYDQVYGAELNIKGTYVYGYNWNLRSMPTNGVEKTGWWRLTFYTPDNSINFGGFKEVTDDGLNGFAPPPDTAGIDIEPAPTVAAEEGDTGPVYRPKVDVTNNLTFIDICIAKQKGSGNKGPK